MQHRGGFPKSLPREIIGVGGQPHGHLVSPDLSGLTAFSNWRQWWPQQAADAITDARERLSAAIARWDLQDLTVLTGGEVAVTLAGRRGAQSVVLKVSPNVAGKTSQLADEAAALKHWKRTGAAATVLAAADGGLTLLLERVTPAMTLRACALRT